ncbi:MAG TPA: VanZ family protein [Pyrinomonadaceae bacterium]|nr:VanZ family protein [Pyrinomonadaceae bacterium]
MIKEDKLKAGARVAGNNSSDFKSRFSRYAPLIIWAALIFIGSSNLLSASHTSAFLVRPLRLLFPTANESTLRTIHFALRKAGHLTEYFILALLAARAFRTSSREILRARWFWASLLLVIAYALFDEFRQSFVSTRTASIYDSMIDSAGGLLGLIFLRWRRKRTKAKESGFD